MKFWAIDSPVMRVLGRLGDIIILNMIFVVGCIPVITIGTSLSALYAVAMKMARGEDPSVWKEFWKAYKRNFRPATICWLVMAVIAILLFVDFRIIGVLKRGSESMYSIMRIVLAVILGVAGIAVYKKHGRGKEEDYVSEQLEFSDGPYVNEEEDEEEE